jgi:hypothetical protein
VRELVQLIKANNPVIGLLALCFIACSSAKREDPETPAACPAFVLPALPGTLTDPVDRANYLTDHYWDHFDFSDTLSIRCPEISEQAFVDYIDVLPYADTAVVRQSVRKMLASSEQETGGKMYAYFLDLADKYLYDTGSPFHNEEFYIPVAYYILSDSRSKATDKTRMTSRLQWMLKNRRGEPATDFAYTLLSGKTGHLQDIKADYTLLLFYNPGCHECEETIAAIRASTLIQSLHRKGTRAILAVYPSDNQPVWQSQPDFIPENWMNGYDKEGKLKSEELYDLTKIPALYLLDKDKKVLLKEVDYATLERWLQRET